MILVPGDFFQSDGPDFEAALPELRALLGRLEAPGGVFITEGDVDSPERMAFMSDGMDNLELARRRGRHHRGAGHDRPHRRDLGALPGRRRRRRRSTSWRRIDDGELRILLSHRPDAAFHVPEGGADLVVAGHTHGGQVAIPFIGPPITMSNVPRAVAAGGLHEIDGTPIYLSNGVGMERATAPQVRFNSRPSIGIVTLT